MPFVSEIYDFLYNNVFFHVRCFLLIYYYKDKNLEPVRYFDYSELKGKEKDLENLLAANLSDLFAEGLMPIFQER